MYYHDRLNFPYSVHIKIYKLKSTRLNFELDRHINISKIICFTIYSNKDGLI